MWKFASTLWMIAACIFECARLCCKFFGCVCKCTLVAIRTRLALQDVYGRVANVLMDLSEERGTLHAYIGKSDFAKGIILDVDLKEVWASEGVVDIFTAKDLPGSNDISPTHLKDEPVLADKEVSFFGQPLFVVVAKTRIEARKAASLVRIKKMCILLF